MSAPRRRKIIVLATLAVVVGATCTLASIGWRNYRRDERAREAGERRLDALCTLRMALMCQAELDGRYPDTLRALAGSEFLPPGFVIPQDITYRAWRSPFRRIDNWPFSDPTESYRRLIGGAQALFEDAEPRMYETGRGRYILLDCFEPCWLAADPRKKYDGGYTQLHQAAQTGNEVIARRLIEAGADVNARVSSGQTPLHHAAAAHVSSIVMLLIKGGADVNAKDDTNRTPLFYALASRPYDTDARAPAIVQALLDAGAQDDIFTAVMRDDSQRAARMLDESPGLLMSADSSGFTPLHWAMQCGSLDAAELLIKRGAAPAVKGKSGVTPAMVAAMAPDGSAAEALLALDGESGMLAAATCGDAARLAELIKVHPELVQGRDKPITPLHAAAAHGHAEAARILLAHGADVDAKDSSGAMPLHLAARCGHKDVVRLLLDNNAAIDARRRYTEYTPLAEALNGDRAELRADVAELLVERGADVNAVGYNSYRPLHYAVMSGLWSVVELLLAKGADPNAAAFYGYRPLHAAKSRDVIKALVKAGADIDAKDDAGRTPLTMAAYCGDLGAFASLLNLGARIDAAGGYDKLLNLAARSCCLDIWKLLRDLRKNADQQPDQESIP
ncbi:MAG TPA: ankyrin repeat domain-containing protein [Planctomycetota bacterium]|nr:ankyrin repeat domain-containing protein [Planctomycetota bacterium]